MNKKLKLVVIAIMIGTITGTVIGCTENKEGNSNKNNEIAVDENYNEVNFTYLENGKELEVKVTSPRKKAVTLSQFMTEMLLALDLGDRMVGTALLDNPILPEFKEAYDKIPELKVGEGHSISKEAFIATGADFVSGWDSSISEQTTGTAEELLKKDITPFLASSYKVDSTIENVYKDFELLGKIFQVEEKATEVINKMKAEIKEITDKNKEIKEKVNMMVYDSGTNDAMVVGGGLANNLIDLAGGNNIFGKEANKPYINVSFESIVAKNPEVILVTDFMAGDPVESKIDFLKNHPALKDVAAIKNNRIYVVELADLSPGVRNSKLIKEIHGYLFEENK